MAAVEGETWSDTTTQSGSESPASEIVSEETASKAPPKIVTPGNGGNSNPPANPVNYGAKIEVKNSNVQVSWDKWMSDGRPRSAIYDHVAVLLILWEDGDLEVDEEVRIEAVHSKSELLTSNLGV
jgi:hypothetical protein